MKRTFGVLVVLVVFTLTACRREAPPAAPKMNDPRLMEVAESCAKGKYGGLGLGGCPLVLGTAVMDDVVRPNGEKITVVTFDEERCGKPRYERGLVLEIDAGGTCTGPPEKSE